MKRVLFVDDNEIVLQTYHKVFSRHDSDWQCFFVSDALAAIDVLEYSQIDIIITDLDMPTYNGAQLLTYVRDKYPGVTRIVFSGSRNHSQNMKTINCAHRFVAKPNSIRDLERMIEDLYTLYGVIIDSSTRNVINGIDKIPALPSVYYELLDEFSKDSYSLKKVGDLISSDVGLTTEILKVVNSSFFGIPSPVTSASQAVTLLGADLVKSLVISAHITRSFTQEELSFSLEGWANHSLLCGRFCKEILLNERAPKEVQDTAFVAGILHDLGRIILAIQFPEKYKRILSICTVTGAPLEELEKKVIGAGHSAVGAYLLALWGFPDSIVHAVAYHHIPDQAAEVDAKLVEVLHFADRYTYELLPEFNPGGIICPESTISTGIKPEYVDQWKNVCKNYAIQHGCLDEEDLTYEMEDLVSLEEGKSNEDLFNTDFNTDIFS